MAGKLSRETHAFAPLCAAADANFRRFVIVNIALVLAVGAFGLFADEPYWREVGHRPWAYDRLFWAALALNGPSGLAAERASGIVGSDFNVRFLAQYAFWALLVWPQWAGYLRLARWSATGSARRRAVHAGCLAALIGGCCAAALVWRATGAPTEYFFDRSAMPARIAGAALAGAWISAMIVFVDHSRRADRAA